MCVGGAQFYSWITSEDIMYKHYMKMFIWLYVFLCAFVVLPAHACSKEKFFCVQRRKIERNHLQKKTLSYYNFKQD